MERTARASLLFASFCLFACAAFGQPTSSSKHMVTCSATLGPPTEAVPGSTAPYSAVRESSGVQTLADGTHIAHASLTEKLYRDSEGRTRLERPFCHSPVESPWGVIVEIRDPVSGYSYILDEQNHVAHRFTWEVRLTAAGTPRAKAPVAAETTMKTVAPIQDASRPTSTTESVGSQTMEGVLVEGTRTTQFMPEGSVGNDRPITVTHETWTSPDLKIVVLSKGNDPRSGELTTRLTNIDLSNPILSLFQPPADYKVVDETDQVTLTFTRN